MLFYMTSPPSPLLIRHYPDPCLRAVCAPVAAVTAEIRQLAEAMVATMYAADGVGLAAPQVGRALRLVVMDVSREKTQPLVLVNPEITHAEGEAGIEEGCLSIPGVTALVPRHAHISVRALDLHGQPQQFDADEMLAICTQHEIDHLNGVLFFDHLSRLRRARLLQKYKKEQAAK